MTQVPSDYKFIDHRAPWYVFRGDSLFATERQWFLGRIPLIVGTVLLTVFGFRLPVLFLGAALLAAALVRLWQQQIRWTVRVPDNGSDMSINRDLATMQGAFVCSGPQTRKLLEPLMLAAYTCARMGDLSGVSKRRRKLNEFLQEMGGADGDDSDLAELDSLMEIRRQMKKDGLL